MSLAPTELCLIGAVKRRCAAVLIVSMSWFTTACVVIEDGEVGVTKSFGAIRDEPLAQGEALGVPLDHGPDRGSGRFTRTLAPANGGTTSGPPCSIPLPLSGRKVRDVGRAA